MAKIGLDDYFLDHTLEQFEALPLIDLDDPIFEGLSDWYDAWKLNKSAERAQQLNAQTVPRIASHRRDDIGNGERFVDQNGHNVKWSAELGWRSFNGKFWEKNIWREVERRAEATVRNILLEAYQTKNKKDREKLTEWAHTSSSMAKINAMLESAKNKLGMSVPAEIFDRDHYLLNLQNGTYNLQTDTLQPHNHDDFITRYTDVAYDPDAAAPIWTKFLERVIPDPDTRLFLQKAAGYSLTGNTSEQCFFLLYGMGKNGKSKFVEAIAAVLGDYAGLMRPEALMLSKYNNNSGDIADLRGLRFVYSIEPPANSTFNTAFIKQQTGGEDLKGKFLYHDQFSFKPTHKLWVGTNHDISIPESDEGIKRRVMQAPFKVWIPEAERDPDLGDKLKTELSGILNWLIEGCRLWKKDHLILPAEVAEATKVYFDRVDPLKDFFDECCDFDNLIIQDDFLKQSEGDFSVADRVARSDLHKKYLEWAKDSGDKHPLQRRKFVERLNEKNLEMRKIGGVWYVIGLCLK